MSALYKIRSKASGKVLDVPGGSKENIAIQQYSDNGGANQHWRLAVVDNGLFKIVSEASKKVLDVPGGSKENIAIQQYADNGGANQHWELVLVGL
jgi:endo-1,4-beta-xylanase